MSAEILIIDDNPDIRNIIKDLIDEAGFKTRVAANYNQALTEIDKKLPDVAIIDVKLEVNVNSHNDDIKNVLSYEKIIQIINNISKKNHKYLAETVAEDIAKGCLQLDTAISVHVSLKKPDIISGKTEVGVEVRLDK